MTERALMTPDELKSIPKGEFVVMKPGCHPMRTRLHLFMDWGITFGEPYQVSEHGQRKVYYAGRQELEEAINARLKKRTDGDEQPDVQEGDPSFMTQEDDGPGPGEKPMASISKKPHSMDSGG